MVVVSTGFEECFREHYPALVAYATATTGDPEVAHELAQEAFARLHRNWDRIAEYDQPGSWLRRVTTNLAIDRHRSRSAEQRAVARWRARPTPPPDEPVGGDPWTELVADLPPRQRAIVTLHYGEDLPVAEIAEVLDLSVNTVKSALSKARERLRSSLKPQETSDG